MTKSRRMRACSAHGSVCKDLVGNPEGRRPSGRLKKIILICIVKK
jgi:hypothetical protein